MPHPHRRDEGMASFAPAQWLQFEPLATYDAEVARGLVHTPEWDERMAKLQAEFDQWASRTLTMVTEPGWYRLTGHGWERVTDEDARAELAAGGGWDLVRVEYASAMAEVPLW